MSKSLFMLKDLGNQLLVLREQIDNYERLAQSCFSVGDSYLAVADRLRDTEEDISKTIEVFLKSSGNTPFE